LDVVRSEPAAHPVVLQVGMKLLRECLVLGRVTDEACVELNRPIEQRGQVFNELVRKATTAKKRKRKWCGFGDGSMVDGTRSQMATGIQSLHIPRICIAKNGFIKVRPAEVRPVEVRPAEVRLIEVRFYVFVLLSPLIPYPHSLFQERKLFGIGPAGYPDVMRSLKMDPDAFVDPRRKQSLQN
jgi:hypothetical protein